MKLLYVIIPVVVVVGGAGGWYAYKKYTDPMPAAREAMARGDTRTAQILLRNAVRKNPGNADAHFRLGTVQLQLGDALSAEKELRTAESLHFDPVRLRAQLGRAYLVEGRFKDLLAEFTPEGLPPAEAAPLYVTRAQAQLALNDFAAADASIAQAELLDPKLFEAPLAAARVAMARKDNKGAEELVDKALELNPKAIDALLLKGRLVEARADRKAAIDIYEKALLLAPDSVPIRLERANALLQGGEDARAKLDIDQVLKDDPKNPTANYLQTFLLVRKQDWKAADATLQRVSMVMDRFPRATYVEALIKSNLNQPEQALDAASKYLAHAPDDPAAYKLLAQIHVRARRFPEAIAVLNKAVAANRADAEIYTLLGATEAQNGRPDLALQALEQADKLSPNNPQLLSRLAAMRLAMGDTEGAAKDYEHTLALSPDQKGAAEALVVTALRGGDVAQANKALDELRKEKDVNPEILGNLTGLVKLAGIDQDGARAAYEEVLKTNPDSVMTRVNLGKLLAAQGKFDEAVAMLTPPLQKDPANPLALNTMVGILVGSGQIDKALPLMEAAQKAAPSNLDFVLGLATLYARANQPNNGLDVLNRVPKEQANAPRVLAVRAQLLNAAGKPDDARQTAMQLLNVAPNDLMLRVALANQLLADNKFSDARNLLNEGLRIQPGAPILLEGLATVSLREGGLDAALATVDQLWKEQGSSAARYLKGDLFATLHRYDEAAAVYMAEMRMGPTSALATRAALALRMTGRAPEGAQVLRDWLASRPDDLAAARSLVSLDIEAHNLDEAQKLLGRILDKQPNDAPSLNNLAWIYEETGQGQRSLTMAQKAYLLSPGPQSADTYGWALELAGKTDDALVLLHQAARQAPDDQGTQYHLAAALNKAGQTEDARTILTKLVAGTTDFDDKPAATKLLASLPATAAGK